MYAEDARRGERHSKAIERNLAGIATGARLKLEAGVITDGVYGRIQEILETAGAREFRPVLYVMPFEKVSGMAVEVAVQDLAHPLSIEYCVERLPRDAFDMIELRS